MLPCPDPAAAAVAAAAAAAAFLCTNSWGASLPNCVELEGWAFALPPLLPSLPNWVELEGWGLSRCRPCPAFPIGLNWKAGLLRCRHCCPAFPTGLIQKAVAAVVFVTITSNNHVLPHSAAVACCFWAQMRRAAGARAGPRLQSLS